MKLTTFIVACMVLLAVQTASVQNDLTLADKSMLERQRFIFEILYRLDHDLHIEEWIKLGGKLVIDKSLYTTYNEYMVRFYDSYRVGGLLPRGEFFSVMQRSHVKQAAGLFNFFFNAKDWETLVHNIAWARLNVNEGMFVYALTMTAVHRADMQGLILPQIYEILPQMFLNSKYVVKAEKFDWDVFNRQAMLEKEFKTTYNQDPASEIVGKRFVKMDWKVWQWWKLMGLDDGWQLEGKSILRENIQVVANDPNWFPIYSNLKMAWIPVDYTRDIGILNDDSVLSYFTEDVGWNAYWYYLNMDYSKLLPSESFKLDKDRRGEWWAYNVQQILARYQMERLSHGLGSIKMLSWNGVVESGYNPQLMACNGNSFSVRKNYWQIESHQNLNLLNMIVSIERRIQDFVNSGRFVLKNGTVLDLTLPESVEIIGSILQSNSDLVGIDFKFLGTWWYLSSIFLSGEEYHDFTIAPNVLMNYETMLRDPLTYSLFKIIVNTFQQFRYKFPPYTNQELLLPGVKIVDVEVSKLLTYFDLVDIDITTLLNNKLIYQDGRLVWDKILLARQMRLNHKIFSLDLQVNADKAQKVVVRVFIGPEFNQYGQKSALIMNPENFMELDEFTADMVVGKNVIHRSSEDFTWTSDDQITYSEWYNHLSMAYGGQYQFVQNDSQAHSLFPDRLILPHGWPEGMPMVLFFMISPYTADYEQYATYDPFWQSGIGSGVRHIDNMPFGYPLERKIDNLYEFLVPNMFVKNVKIYHLEKYNKYFPMKYKNYGNFDYNY